MKKIFLIMAVLATGFTAMAQQKADEVISVNSDKYDFGKIKQGVPVTTYFTITNTSDKPIVIENAWAGCGCTTPEFSKEPIAPGGTSKLKVGYNAAAAAHFDKAVNIKIVGYQEPKIVTITGEVVAAAADATSKVAPPPATTAPVSTATVDKKADDSKKAPAKSKSKKSK